MIRLISPSEQRTLGCTWRHALAYTGHLTDGTVLRKKTTALVLREGRAWGRAIAATYENADRTDCLVLGHNALDESLDQDADEQREAGMHMPEEHAATAARLHAMLDHHLSIADPIPLEAAELELSVPIPSRTGRRPSSRYRFQGFVDGLHTDEHGVWVVEEKLRRQLTPLWLVEIDPQLRLYAWAARGQFDVEPVGVILEERLNALPADVKINLDGSVSKVQSCTPGAYEVACVVADQEPDEGVLEQLRAKEWFRRQRVFFRPGELSEAAREITSTARHIGELDSGRLAPVRAPSPARCPGCPYREICANVGDTELVDALYERRPPKRDREELAHAA